MSESVEGGSSRTENVGSSASAAVLTEEMRKKLSVFDMLDGQYRSNDKVKAVMDKILNGDADKISDIFSSKIDDKKEEIKAAQAAGDSVEVAALKKELSELKSGFEGMRTYLESSSVIDARTGIEAEYQKEFSKLASSAGFEKNFAGYEELYDFARLESQKIAKKYDLVVKDANGNEIPDILLGYKPELMKEAFDKAKTRLGGLKFDVMEAKREHIMNERKLQQKNLNDEINLAFGKDNIKNRADLKRQLNNLFEARLRQKGLSLSDL